jgi:hypothetical protein
MKLANWGETMPHSYEHMDIEFMIIKSGLVEETEEFYILYTEDFED